MGKSSSRNCGNVDLRGKKVKLLSCRCCECLDLRDKLNEKVLRKEIDWELNAESASSMTWEAYCYEHDWYNQDMYY